MNMKPIVAVAIALAVGVTVFAGVLIPAIESGIETKDTYTNEGIKLSKVSNDSSHEITWDHTEPNVITIDDTAIEMSTTANPRGFVIASENFYLKWYNLGSTTIGVQFYSGTVRMDGNVSSSKDMTVSIESGSVSVTAGTDTNTYTLGDYAYMLDSSGNYVLKDANATAKVMADTEIVLVDVVQVASGYPAGIFANGNIEDGLTYSAYFYNPSTVAFASPTQASASVNGHIDLYNVSGFGVTATQGDTTKTLTFNSFIVPSEVTAERTVHAGDSVIQIMSILPIFIVLGMIVAVVWIIFKKR